MQNDIDVMFKDILFIVDRYSYIMLVNTCIWIKDV
jgi:hypothetical protein